MVKARFARDAAGRFSKGTFTATQTGAKKLAEDRRYGNYVAKQTKSGIKGLGERAPSQEEMEDTIKRGGK